jgi:hypothetical protein
MKRCKTYPLIADVEAQPNKRLLVHFRNGVKKLYDCKRILALPAFESLRSDEALFRSAHADRHGYGVIWSDELDLAESEVWIGGRVVREKSEAYASGPEKQTAKATAVTKRRRRDRQRRSRQCNMS